MSEKEIWSYLLRETGNEYGTAAIMGNLMAESSLNPFCATGKNKTPNYVTDADSGKIDFENDGVAFGLVQWCYHTRKAGLLKFAKQKGASVGAGYLQLEYLVKEMSESYKSVWKAVTEATNIRTASDKVMLNYEKPGTTTEAAKKKRAEYGQKFYNQFAVKPEPKPTPEPSGKKQVMATVNVNLRSRAGKDKDNKIGELKKGQTLEVIGSENGWYKVAVYVMKDFVKEVE